MTKIAGSGEYVIDQVQQIVRRHVPGANCALLDYGKRVGCGELDDDQVAKDAERMARLIADANRQILTDC